MTYVVYFGQSQVAHRFTDRDQAERFFNRQVEKVGAPVELVEDDGQGHQRTIVYTRRHAPPVE